MTLTFKVGRAGIDHTHALVQRSLVQQIAWKLSAGQMDARYTDCCIAYVYKKARSRRRDRTRTLVVRRPFSPATWGTLSKYYVMLDSGPLAPCYENVMSSAKPGVLNI